MCPVLVTVLGLGLLCHTSDLKWDQWVQNCCWHAMSATRYTVTAGGIPHTAVVLSCLALVRPCGMASGNAVICNEWGIKVTVQSENVGIGVLVYLQFQWGSWLLSEESNCSIFLENNLRCISILKYCIILFLCVKFASWEKAFTVFITV